MITTEHELHLKIEAYVNASMELEKQPYSTLRQLIHQELEKEILGDLNSLDIVIN